MFYLIFVLSFYPARVLPMREDSTREEMACIAIEDSAQERDLQSWCPSGPVEWGDADTPKDTSVLVMAPVFHMNWATGVLGCEDTVRG